MSKPADAAPKRAGMLPVAEALAIVLDVARDHLTAEEQVAVQACDGRVLARDLVSLRTQPPFDASAMDGFAIHAADSDPPGRPLRLIGESAAGHPFDSPVGPGEAIRISTGAKMPAGADTVLIQEDAEVSGDTVIARAVVRPDRHIRRAGRDFRAGDTLLGAGRRLAPGSIALAGAMNHAALPVYRRPRVAILATGDELALPGSTENPEAIIATNGYAVAALCRRAGAEVVELDIARDTPESVHAAFDAAEAWRADCLVTIGGASVGVHDLIAGIAAERGAKTLFRKVALRPGKPFTFSTVDRGRRSLIAGLPGNPISALVCARLFLAPMIAAMQGDAAAGEADLETAVLGVDLPANDERQDHLRAVLTRDSAGRVIATPLGDQDSSLLAIYAQAQALIVRAPLAPPAHAGETCPILRI